MANEVYANGNEISCKSGMGKVISGFPDVCLSPPSPPAGPVPIPYPLFSFSSDMTEGSESVQIGGKPVMLKDKSYFKKCTGDEAATKSFGQGVISHTITGKVYFISWSPNVLIESENVVRHFDMMTSNHASPAATESTPQKEIEKLSPTPPVDCDKVYEKYPVESYDEQKSKGSGVYRGKQSHHVIQNSHFQKPRGTTITEICPGYTEGGAPCIPLSNGTNTRTEHGRVSKMQKADGKRYRDRLKKKGGKNPTYSEAREDAKKQLMAKPKPGLTENDAECILIKVDEYFKEACKPKGNPELRAPSQRSIWKSLISKIRGKGGLR